VQAFEQLQRSPMDQIGNRGKSGGAFQVTGQARERPECNGRASCRRGATVPMLRFRRDYFFPGGTRRLSSSDQFWTRIISVTGVGFLFSNLTMRNRCPSRDRS
jgi:hypothetical protein